MARKIAFGRNYKKELADWFKPVYKIIPKTMKKKDLSVNSGLKVLI